MRAFPLISFSESSVRILWGKQARSEPTHAGCYFFNGLPIAGQRRVSIMSICLITLVGTSRCDVPARARAGGSISAAREG